MPSEMHCQTVCQKSVRFCGLVGQDTPQTAWGWNPQPRRSNVLGSSVLGSSFGVGCFIKTFSKIDSLFGRQCVQRLNFPDLLAEDLVHPCWLPLAHRCGCVLDLG